MVRRPSPVSPWAASSDSVEASRAFIAGGCTEWGSASGPGLAESSCAAAGGSGSKEGGKVSDGSSVGDDLGCQRSLSERSCGGGFEAHGHAGVVGSDGAAPDWQLILTASSSGAGSEGAGRASETESAVAAPGWRRR
jgi:hypothetical protein